MCFFCIKIFFLIFIVNCMFLYANFLFRSLLRQGLLRLNLWPVVMDANTGESNMSPMGSTALNPDGNNSAVLYIELDTYAHPVAFPTGGLGEETQM